MVGPLKGHHIPLRVKNVYKPQQSGTLVHSQTTNNQAIKAITAIQGIALTASQSGPLTQITEMVDDSMFHTIGNHADVMISAQSSDRSLLCFVIPTNAGPDAVHSMQNLLETRIAGQPSLAGWSVQPITIITAIGAALNGVSSLSSQIMHALNHIRLLAISQSPARCSLSVVVTPRDAEAAYRQLHALTD
jgi:aspartokinase